MINDTREFEPVFRWLHISDLHLATEDRSFLNYILEGSPLSHDQLERQGLKGIIQSYGGIDCIVTTGDFFHQGHLGKEKQDIVQEVLETLYQTCQNVSKWPESIESKKRLCFCPGNHDLNRRCYEEDSDDQTIVRLECIQTEATKSSGFFSAQNLEREIVVKKAFRVFFHTMPKLKKRDRAVKSFSDNQIVCFSPNPRDNNFSPTVLLIGLNTALLAGQQMQCDNLASESQKAEQLFIDAKESAQKKNYLDARKNIKEALDKIVLVNGDKIEDYGKMCLPEKTAFQELQRYIELLRSQSGPNKPVIPVLFGHHSIDFFNQNAQSELKKFILSNNIQLYLCGHSHQLVDHSIGPIHTYSRSIALDNCLQVTSGGLFYDEEHFNQISFSIGTISWNKKLNRQIYFIDYYLCNTNYGNNAIGIWMQGQSIWPPQIFGVPAGTNITVENDESDRERENISIERNKNKENKENIDIVNRKEPLVRQDEAELSKQDSIVIPKQIPAKDVFLL